MIYDEVKPNTSGWNQVKSEFERNVKIFVLLQESPDESVRTMAKKNADLMQKAFHNMNCHVDEIDCKCDGIKLITTKRPLMTDKDIKEWHEGITHLEKVIQTKKDLTNMQKLDVTRQLQVIQVGNEEKIDELNSYMKKLIAENIKTAEQKRIKKVDNNKSILLQRITNSDLDKKTKADLTKKAKSIDSKGKKSQLLLETLNKNLQENMQKLADDKTKAKDEELSKVDEIDSETSDGPNQEEDSIIN